MRIAVISDIHANLTALRRVLADIDTLGVDELWCLGDIVGIGPRPAQVIELLRERSTLALAGNHDVICTGPAPQLTGPFGAPLQLARFELSGDQFQWLAALSSDTTREGVHCVHGTPVNPTGIREHGIPGEEFMSLHVARRALTEPDAPALTLVGHTHTPEAYRCRPGARKPVVKSVRAEHDQELRTDRDLCILNPGAVGRPQSDRDPRAAWMLLDLDTQRARWRLLDYPVEYEYEAMHRAGLAGRHADQLFTSRASAPVFKYTARDLAAGY